MIANLLGRALSSVKSSIKCSNLVSSIKSSTNSSNSIGTIFRSILNPLGGGQIRSVTYGQEFQPSRRRQKRRHGYLHRKSTANGRKIIARRIAKGRSSLSH